MTVNMATTQAPVPPAVEAAPETTVPLTAEELDLIHAAGLLAEQIAGLEAKQAETKLAQEITAKRTSLYEAEDRIQSLMEAGMGPLETRLERGGDFVARSGKQKKQTIIKQGWAATVYDFIGAELWGIVKIGVGDLRKYLNPKQLAEVITEEHTGARQFSIERAAK